MVSTTRLTVLFNASCVVLWIAALDSSDTAITAGREARLYNPELNATVLLCFGTYNSFKPSTYSSGKWLMKSCKEGSSWTNSPQMQQRNEEVMKQSATWTDTVGAENEVTLERAEEKPG